MSAKRIIIVYDHNRLGGQGPQAETIKSNNDKIVYWVIDNNIDNNIEGKVNNLKNQNDTEFCIVIHGDKVYGYVNNKFKNEQKIHVFKYSSEGFDKELYKFVVSLVLKLNNTSWEEAFDNLWDHCVKTNEKKKVNEILRLFLPLDIDMQALEIIQKDEEKVRKYLHSNKDIEGMFQSRKGDNHYRQKLYDLWYLIGEKPPEDGNWKPSEEAKKLTPIDNPDPNLRKLAGLNNGSPKESPIYKFLEFLDTSKNDGKDIKDVTDYLCNPFKNWKINNKDINTFHDWYCALASCLRGEEACKE